MTNYRKILSTRQIIDEITEPKKWYNKSMGPYYTVGESLLCLGAGVLVVIMLLVTVAL